MKLSTTVNDTRSKTYPIIISVWGLVALYAILHDQYIVRIDPTHFTVYHPPIWDISNPKILAAIHAFLASISPGLTLGLAAMVVARLGPLPKVDTKFIVKGTIILILTTEAVAALTGLWVYLFRSPLYPPFIYPSTIRSLVITQTIQVSSYLSGFIFSGIFLLVILVYRVKRKGICPDWR